MEDGASPIDRYILRLSGKAKPRVCFIGTPSGDLPEHVAKFYSAFDTCACTPSHLAFFRLPGDGGLDLYSLQKSLLKQDVIYVGPGNTRAAMAVWRDWGIDQALRQAYVQGVLLCGMSAGAMCWFEQCLTDSYWQAGYQPLRGMGLLAGACGVHHQTNAVRQERMEAAIQARAISSAIAIDDFAAVLFESGTIRGAVHWKNGAHAYLLTRHGQTVETTTLTSEFLVSGE